MTFNSHSHKILMDSFPVHFNLSIVQFHALQVQALLLRVKWIESTQKVITNSSTIPIKGDIDKERFSKRPLSLQRLQFVEWPFLI